MDIQGSDGLSKILILELLQMGELFPPLVV